MAVPTPTCAWNITRSVLCSASVVACHEFMHRYVASMLMGSSVSGDSRSTPNRRANVVPDVRASLYTAMPRTPPVGHPLALSSASSLVGTKSLVSVSQL